ncbi:MAG TPA: hypothetical protein VN796_10950 [Acidimicrobiales bacterium]|nr:hypothetical protein [Acidimicrobiales bacterium]
MRRILLLGLGSLTLLLAACGGTTPGAVGGTSPRAVLNGAIAAAKTSGSFHYVLVATAAGTTQSVVGDTSASEGRQILSTGSAKIEAEAIGKTVYVQGNVGGLENQLSFPSAEATRYAGKWISIVPADSPYSSVVRAVTLASALTQIEPTGHLTLTAATTRSGHAVIGVRGPLPGTATKGVTGSIVLYVSTTSPSLPVTFEGKATGSGKTETDIGHFTRWGKPLDLVAPSGTIAYSTLSTSG